MKCTEESGRWYVLLLLTLVYAFNIADRYVMSTLIEPIKADLHLSDSAIGFLTGVALALFYVTAGLPLAVIADRTSRRNMVSWALAIWSVVTAICGLAQTFWQLLMARIFVGVGEAGGTPPSHSLISDYFRWQDRALALTLMSVGASFGSMLGSGAGYVSDAWGWRSAFFILGLPGVALALLILWTVREPVRGRLDAAPAPVDAPPRLRSTLAFVAHQRALLHCLAGGTLYTLWSWGLMWWTPSFLVRSHHMALGDAGGALSPMHGVGGTAVLLATGAVMARLSNQDARRVPIFCRRAGGGFRAVDPGLYGAQHVDGPVDAVAVHPGAVPGAASVRSWGWCRTWCRPACARRPRGRSCCSSPTSRTW
ncbi:MAG: MFS transporter [Steroidobacteraceae bacterium]